MRKKVLTILILLGIVDIVIPVPILALILIWVVATRAPWFPPLVKQVYRGE